MTPAEFVVFCERWYPDVSRYLYWKIRQFHDAEDLTQHVFASLTKRRAALRPDTADRYLWVVARYTALNWRTKQYRTQTVALNRRLSNSSPSAEVEMLDQLMMDAALALLSPRQRLVVLRTVIDGQRVNDLAHDLGVSGDRVWRLRRIALAKLFPMESVA